MSDNYCWLNDILHTGWSSKEFEMEALHLLTNGHAEKSPALPSLSGGHFYTHISVTRSPHPIQQTGHQRIPTESKQESDRYRKKWVRMRMFKS